ncbi:MAG: methyltransferase domain-containing protein [Balneolaceae bacterium]
MSCCGHCRDAGDFFSDRTAKRDLRHYLKKGPKKSTALLLNAIRSAGVHQASLLDVGSGVGVIQLELFKEGLQHAVNVDASASYQETARMETEKRGLSERADYHYGDAVELASKLPDAEIVTLDRVICCYPDPEKLIQATASKSKYLYGVVYPRERVITGMIARLGNLWFRLRGSEFRTYLFPSGYIDSLIKKQGFRSHKKQKTLLWHVVTYTRNGSLT